MTFQRRRGIPATIYLSKLSTDDRGNKLREPDLDNPIVTRVALSPQRSARAEVPGQQHINVTRLVVDPRIEGIDIYGRVEFRGASWDIVTPPAYHRGTRHTRHNTIDIRERPGG